MNLEHSIDFIINTEKFIFLCGYSYLNNIRTGCLYWIDITNFEIVHKVETSGTLHACYKDNRMYIANAKDIAIYDCESAELIMKQDTTTLNSYIYVNEHVYVADISGCIKVYDLNLNLINTIKIEDEPIWVFKIYGSVLYFGNEKGNKYKYNLSNNNYSKIGSTRLGIVDILLDKDKLIISSYDEDVEIFDVETLQHLRTMKKIGALWKILKHDSFYICSCIYEGIKIFNENFELIKRLPVESICYGVAVYNNLLIWADFYKNKIEWEEIS